MAKQKGNKNVTGWSRFRLWVENNQKVVWVLLLLIISPMFAFPVASFVNPSSESRVTIDHVYGERISQADYTRTRDALGSVISLTASIDGIAQYAGGGAPGPYGRARILLEADAPLAFYIFKRKALDMGLRVSDAELAEHIRELWQWMEAATLAAAEIQGRSPQDDLKDQSAAFRRRLEELDLAKKKKAELEAVKAFDGASWGRMVAAAGRGARGGIRVKDFEEVLRDLYLIAKLEDSIRSSVEVTPDEAYEKYRRDSQTRKLSWTEIKASDALKEAVAKAITPDEVKAHYDAHASEFEKTTAIRAKWLLVPLDHFKEKAGAALTDDDIKKHYEENRNDYRRPTILASELSFSLRSEEESSKLREAAYKSLDEVKDAVREAAVTKRANADMSAFATQLRTRLRPDRAATEAEKKAPAASFESLVKEFPFLGTGTPAFASRDEAKDAFGDAYTTQVTSWFARADAARSGQRPSIEAPEFPLQGEKGMVFYQKPEVRERFRPALQDIEAKVREAIVKSKATARIADALAGPVKELNEGKKTLADVVAAGIDVKLPVAAPGSPTDPAPGSPTDPAPGSPTDPAPGSPTDPARGIHLAAGPVQTTAIHVSRNGPLMVPKPADGAGKEDAKDDTPADDAKEVEHPASTEILRAAFALEKQGEAGVAQSESEAAAYIVRFDDVIYPDPAGFAARKESIERELLLDAERTRITAWRTEVLREARGRAAPEEAVETAGAAEGTPAGAAP
jgi:hypothetical protein